MSLFTPLRRRGRVRPALVGVASMALVLTACGGTSDESGSGDPIKDASITFASTAIASYLDPAANPTTVGRTYSKQVFDQLVTFDADGTLQPALATEWERVGDQAMVFTLREGVTFSSGAPLTAEAVVANVDRILSGNEAYATIASRLGTLRNAKVVSDTEVRINTSSPDPIILNRLTLLDIVDPETFDTDAPAGTGAFVVEDHDPGNSISLVRNDDSWRATDNIAEVTIQAIPDPSTLSSAMQTGEVDVAFGLPADVSTQLESRGFTTINESAGSAAINSLIADAEPKLEDVRVRQAINHAIDREAFVEGALGGFGTPNGSQLLQEGYFGFDEDLPHYEYDLDKAKELVQEAGVEGLELPIATTALFKPQAEAVAGFLNAAGFESEVVVEDFSAFLATALQSSEYPLLYWQTDYYELRDISSVVRFGPTAPGQQAHIEEGRYQELFVQQSSELDEAKREAQIKEMAKILHDDAGVLFLAWTDNLYTAAPHISDVPLAGDSLVRVEEIVVTE